MATTRQCPQCGSELPGDSPDAPCPACLMQLGLRMWERQTGHRAGTNLAATEAQESKIDVPQPDELARQFPQLEILELLGHGGMGAVYKARQKSLDRFVALKVIKPRAADNVNFSERFVREARALAHLSHPNIVTVHDFGQTEGLYFFIMEYVDGLNLRQMMQHGNITPSEALEIVPRVCDALQYAHDEGVVHRDIKPENILLDKNGRVKIADFGLAKLLKQNGGQTSLTKTHHVMGTPHYMAPEQLEKPVSVDHRADIYSLGVVIYEMLTGELPIGRFAPPSQKVSLDVSLDQVVLRTLEKEPELRYQRVSDVRTDMELAARQSSVPEPVVSAHVLADPPTVVDKPPRVEKPPQVQKPPVYEKPKPDKKEFVDRPRDRAGDSPGFFGVIRNRQTYLNVVYLLAAFPLGLVYFTFLVTGLSVGLGLVVAWIGVFVLLGTAFGARWLGGMERQITTKLLNIEISVQPAEGQPEKRRWLGVISDPLTWKSMAYMLLKLPLGTITFSIVVALFSASIAAMSHLFAYRFSWVNGVFIGEWSSTSFPVAVALAAFGFFLFIVTLHVCNWMAKFSGRIAEYFLGRR